jgi:hypothetical protein
MGLNCDKVEWIFPSNPSMEMDVQVAEGIMGIKFPNDYKECAMKYGGGIPQPQVFDVENWGEAVFDRIFSFDSSDPYYYIANEWNGIKDRLIDGIYPIACEGFGNDICFDYREGKEKPPKVVFWDHEIAYESPEKAIFYICDSFTELLSKLHSGD